MVQKITGEAPFQVLATNFSISPSLQNYVLQISADGTNYSDLFTVSAGQTKMVTNVANGSYYRMKNNASEVTINWRTQCNDGQGGGGGSYVLPPATEQTLGGIKVGSGLTVQADGTLSAEGGEGGVLVVDSLSSEEAASAPVGSLIGQYKGEESVWKEMPTSNTDVSATTILIKGDVDFSSASVQLLLLNSSTNYYFEVGRSGGKWTKMYNANSGGQWYLDDVNIGTNVTGEYDGDVLQLSGSNWSVTFTKQENGDWLGEIAGTDSHFKYVSNISGNNAFKYEAISPIEANLYMKVLGGTVAHWQGIRDANQVESFEIIYDDIYDFTTFCDNKIMFSIRYQYGGETRYAFMDATNQSIVLYSDSGKTTEITRVSYLGNPVSFETQQYGSSHYVWVEWREDGVYFYNKQSSTLIENLIDFHIEGVHFVRITDPTKATASDLGLGNSFDYGIPEWNNEGIVTKKQYSVNAKNIKVNRTTYQTTQFITAGGEGNFPDRFYVPTEGGTAGQILQSNGTEAAPSWTTMIKAQKITSAAYEALVQAGQTDPNTLYLIDDSNA